MSGSVDGAAGIDGDVEASSSRETTAGGLASSDTGGKSEGGEAGGGGTFPIVTLDADAVQKFAEIEVRWGELRRWPSPRAWELNTDLPNATVLHQNQHQRVRRHALLVRELTQQQLLMTPHTRAGGDKVSEPTVLIRGLKSAEYHVQAAEPTMVRLRESGHDATITGGGRIKHSSKRRSIFIYG